MTELGPTVLIIFGAGGDLTHRKIVPAMFNLFLDRLLPHRVEVLGLDRMDMSEDAFRQRMREGVAEFSRRGAPTDESWAAFAPRLRYMRLEIGDARAFDALAARLSEIDQQWGGNVARLFYMAIPPSLFEQAARRLDGAGLGRSDARSRVVVEKPFGRDLESARRLNRSLLGAFEEPQVYRIDHYLGKETVQNILAFRFANSMFEPIWNRRYIDHVQITVAEDIGVEHRGEYYEQAGALRDVVQNHLLQVLCLVAMEPPVSYQADEIRNKKVDVLRAIRPIPRDQLHHNAVRGQYGQGWIRGQRVTGYRHEPHVSQGSATETFAAIKFFVDNWRWQDVPFYVRTGKRLPARVSEVTIQFRPVPHQSFPSSAFTQPQPPNRLIIRIQPNESILQRFLAKVPGEQMRLSPVEMRFGYRQALGVSPPEAYETLLLDVMQGDPTQFMRADQLEAAWHVVEPILEVWRAVAPADFPNYAAGTWGPEAAEVLIAQDGRTWFAPVIEEQERP
jgi:glucose-6-phosphate 1-dehydrogenase